MIDLDDLYYEWLLTRIAPEGVLEGVAYVGDFFQHFPFERRVGNDINRAIEGSNLRKEFMLQFEDANFDPHVTNDLMLMECTWLEMLVALSRSIDYLYDGGVEERFIELVENLGLGGVLDSNPNRVKTIADFDISRVEQALLRVDNNLIDANGHGGLFPLYTQDHPDQRGVEIWDQSAAYFRERLEGVLWTSTS